MLYRCNHSRICYNAFIYSEKGRGAVLGIFWFLMWQIAGVFLSLRLFPSLERLGKLTLGSVFGSVLAIWSPIPFSFVFGFSFLSHLIAALIGLSLLLILKPRLTGNICENITSDWKTHRSFLLFLLFPFLALCVYLLLTHTLRQIGGALYTGQCTFGDMAMHLGFITSIAQQGTFPPEYSILPGERLCYPFLCDSVSSSLYLLGTPLRAAYLIPAFFALAQVFCGFYLFARSICRHRSGALLSFVLFFLNGGLGLIYFFRDHSFYELFTGFYHTPTNLTDEGIRWVNVIVDMLLPQRATLFGWAGLFSVLWLLYLAVFCEKKSLFLPAGLLGGLLPMIHTHSYFALGLIAACWLFYSAVRDHFSSDWLRQWVSFGLPAVLLALPQLFLWTFHSVDGNEQFLRFHFDWVNNGEENWLWFWLKNVGPLFLIAPVAFFFSGKRQRAAAFPALFIFVLCEFVVFQPNVYDNNKLFYVSYALFCMLSGDFIVTAGEKLRSRTLRAALLSVLLILTTNAAFFTLGREIVSGTPRFAYKLFSRNDVAAAEYISENTAPDALFLTANNHNNPVASLTGRNVFCGCPSYLFYHGLDYTERMEAGRRLFSDRDYFSTMHEKLGIDYVYIGDYEKGLGCDSAYFNENFPVVFSSGEVTIYKTS